MNEAHRLLVARRPEPDGVIHNRVNPANIPADTSQVGSHPPVSGNSTGVALYPDPLAPQETGEIRRQGRDQTVPSCALFGKANH